MTTSQTPEPGRQRRARNPEVLRSADLADAFNVDTKTVVRWAQDGRLPDGAVFRTPGGHRRFRRAVMEQHWPGMFPPPAPDGQQ